ncbi:DUF305 domain-containing protein [Knoellia locipacati]|uniref:DUF305 domain-containing protein n=1 Tax=Knoellia locipacati TaxID=882824 RepID=UPI0038500B9A
MHRHQRHLILTALGTTAVLTLGACASSGAGSGAHGGMMSTSSSASTRANAGESGDVMFAQMMIPHHEQAVEMADLALQKDASAEVTTLARQIKAAQDPEIATMTRWLDEWQAPMSSDQGHEGHGGGMMSGGDMRELSAATGPKFDELWLTMMIEHHEGAVVMAQDVLGTTANPEVETMARAIVKGQKEEIATMKSLLATAS